jgi:hydroxyethylthiazole kinase-like uncharacterized protein yjeF
MYPVKVITVEKSRYLESKANEGGLSFAEMMENAGRGTALAIQRRIGARGKRVLILVGPGNNGGDGLVAAHYLWEMGARVTCYLWKRNVDDDNNFRRAKEDRLPMVWAEDDDGFDALRGLMTGADAIVDALLGVGVDRPIGGSLKDLLDAVRQTINAHSAPAELAETVPSNSVAPAPLIVAVDCPTGLNCDSGALDPAAMPADLTVTFAYPKQGLLRFPGAEAVGHIVVVDIGIPPELASGSATLGAQGDLWSGAHRGWFGELCGGCDAGRGRGEARRNRSRDDGPAGTYPALGGGRSC